MVRISRSGVESIRFAPQKPHQYCVFEHVYFARPDSLVFGRPVDHSREMLGRLLAREHPADADVVVPVPDSGVPAAVGYSLESGLPFRMGLIRNHYIGRTFIEPDAGHPRFRREAEAQSRAHAARRQARGAGGRFHRPRHHQPQDRAHGARGRRHRSARAHQLPAHGFALLLRHRHAHARGAAGLGGFADSPAPAGREAAEPVSVRSACSKRFGCSWAPIRSAISRSKACAAPSAIPTAASALPATPASIPPKTCSSKCRAGSRRAREPAQVTLDEPRPSSRRPPVMNADAAEIRHPRLQPRRAEVPAAARPAAPAAERSAQPRLPRAALLVLGRAGLSADHRHHRAGARDSLRVDGEYAAGRRSPADEPHRLRRRHALHALLMCACGASRTASR